MRTSKLVFLRALERSNSVCRYRYAQNNNEIHSVRAKNADCTCTHSTKNKIKKINVGPCGTYVVPKHFNLVPRFLGYEIAQRLIFP